MKSLEKTQGLKRAILAEIRHCGRRLIGKTAAEKLSKLSENRLNRRVLSGRDNYVPSNEKWIPQEARKGPKPLSAPGNPGIVTVPAT
jgi:hypothetical protein